MVKELQKGNKKLFVCEECRFAYLDKEMARRCEEFCYKNHSCSSKITKNAVGRDENYG